MKKGFRVMQGFVERPGKGNQDEIDLLTGVQSMPSEREVFVKDENSSFCNCDEQCPPCDGCCMPECECTCGEECQACGSVPCVCEEE